jgi:hypothetical protein
LLRLLLKMGMYCVTVTDPCWWHGRSLWRRRRVTPRPLQATSSCMVVYNHVYMQGITITVPSPSPSSSTLAREPRSFRGIHSAQETPRDTWPPRHYLLLGPGSRTSHCPSTRHCPSGGNHRRACQRKTLVPPVAPHLSSLVCSGLVSLLLLLLLLLLARQALVSVQVRDSVEAFADHRV